MGRCFPGSVLAALIFTCSMLIPVSVLLTFTTIDSTWSSIEKRVSVPNVAARLQPIHVIEDVQAAVKMAGNMRMQPEKSRRIEFMLVTGERSVACGSSEGSYVMMMSYKNKIDYCNIHGCKVWYALEVWENGFTGTWARYPLLLKLMKANPKIQWFMWMDSDAIFTDLNFTIPIRTYEDWGKKMVVPGYWEKVYAENPDWISLNAGIFLMKNCEWSHKFLRSWMRYGDPSNLASSKMRLNSFLTRPKYWDPDDQSALVYLLNLNKTDSQANVYLESGYDLHGYWKFIVDNYENITNNDKSRPFVTHFCGCNFCGRKKISADCYGGFRRAFNFADNQLLSQVSLSHLSLSSPDPLLKATSAKTSPESP
ncbi:probable glycosyltransferase 3 [Nymphaea colorata]|nr:probable glycosyltransferase 3 [Nymphaea colorata]